MIIAILVVLGLCLGSFVNALVWRLHEQWESFSVKKRKAPSHKHQIAQRNLSVLKGRSMCVDCRHELAAIDLIPVLSWLSLRGKCRYCHASISWQYPLVELLTGVLFVGSYAYWPRAVVGREVVVFGLWLLLLTGFMALIVYDLRWMFLPDKIMKPLFVVAIIQVLYTALILSGGLQSMLGAVYGLVIGGGLFYLLFQISSGRWIGGGDVKLGAVLGLIVGGPLSALLIIFVASILGSLIAIPLLLTHQMNKKSHMPFGPFLILAAIIIKLFGASLITYYKHKLLITGYN